MNDPSFQKKFIEGPNATIWVGANGPISLGPHLAKWFAYTLVVGTLCAYLAATVLPRPGEDFMRVLRVVGTTAFIAYASAHWSNVIWKRQPVSCALKDTLDGLIYGLITGAVFGALWPK